MNRARRSASEAKCWKDFERDVAVKPGVMRAIYFAHSARAEQRDDLEMIKPSATGKLHRAPRFRLSRERKPPLGLNSEMK